jgi:FkbM family methyltransferase
MLKIFVHATGNKPVQNLLERIVRKSHALMGIGEGGNVASSGERDVIVKLRNLYAPPYCIFDVGSHRGEYVDELLSVLSGEKVHIHCFEPAIELFKILSAKIGGDERFVLNQLGLGRKQEVIDLFYDEKVAGGSLSRRRLDHFGIFFSESEQIALDTVDHYCREKKVDYIHLLKIDVEGHEYDVLLGAQEMLRNKRIGMITFEFGGCNIDSRIFFQDYFYFFKEKGMNLYRLTPSGYLYPIKTYKEIDEQFRVTNFLAMDDLAVTAKS